jgi:hypothetical protein
MRENRVGFVQGTGRGAVGLADLPLERGQGQGPQRSTHTDRSRVEGTCEYLRS